VTGADSLWTNHSSLFIGERSDGKQLTIAAGGALTDNGLAIGSLPAGYNGNIVAGSGNVNLVIVSEPGAVPLVLFGMSLAFVVRRIRRAGRPIRL
jgi:T5SS/PEP-CTERM-associated repeat protein